MITGVLLILAGEAVVFRSWGLVLLLAGFALANALYMPLSEERGLRQRFGAEYDTYRAHVPRWLPQLRGWDPSERDGGSQSLPRGRPRGAR
jgi:protein-S-isoprenylcysteine O-methyltransferase Ste14